MLFGPHGDGLRCAALFLNTDADTNTILQATTLGIAI
jgi:hypothetical protein